jgi:molybdopterin converting factor small subunit
VQILSEPGVVPVLATNLLSNHYNKTRNAYYLALDAAQHDVRNFVTYALRGFVDELREQRKYTPEQVTELTTSLAKKYPQCGERTPARDMNELVKMNLVERVARRHYTVRRNAIEAFIPPVAR